jgi:preprotein translocase subunit SecF
VLSQNLKKGARGLTDLLETEAEASLNERKNHARKIGEQAGTKLLLPMILMLGIVLVILMVPVFLSF